MKGNSLMYDSLCIILNETTAGPLAKLWGVRKSSLLQMLRESEKGGIPVPWQSRLREIEEQKNRKRRKGRKQ